MGGSPIKWGGMSFCMKYIIRGGANKWKWVCKIFGKCSFDLTWSETCVIRSSTDANEATTFVTTDTKLCTPV